MRRFKRDAPKAPSKHPPKHLSKQGPPPLQRFEAQVLDGLGPFAARELAELGASLRPGAEPEAVPFTYAGPWAALASLRTVVAVFFVERFAVPRPKALLGHQHLGRLLERVAELRAAAPFASFRLSAAGRESAVYARLAVALAEASGLPHDAEGGDLLLRVRPAEEGWEVLLRLAPRPLSVRPWRVCNMAGGLNATVAAAMLACAPRCKGERVLNLMCGSGTLLAERHALGPARLVGVDIDPAALACARANLQAAGAQAELVLGDARALSLADASADLLLADPPWGDQLGSHRANAELYPALLAEAARLAAGSATFVLLSHEIRLMERVLAAQDLWRVGASYRVYHGGHYPRFYLLERAALPASL